MSTICQGFSHFSRFLHHFVFAELDTSSIRVKVKCEHLNEYGASKSD